ncbi:hypothetical protein SAMN05216474_2768 [Lishizhenia tianjinensis]|uniref:Uncharacterized protein n=1 Tax=Lishizhenia tianjinensis TaxID=477690 RepID=A0A1I7BFB1_9FLAO|nr:hypothetical protein [Lishizhenia tianjinensis]SFT85791.1 hypothetical protein SAMN05216474_2768 [Lishizhenia tianjinensis]
MKNYTNILILLFSSLLIACSKKEPTLADITVKNTANEVVPGVRVILYGESTETPNKDGDVVLKDTATTDIFGVAHFDYTENFKRGQAGFAVLNIDAEVTDANGTTFSGTGTLKIEEETLNKETVFIQ